MLELKCVCALVVAYEDITYSQFMDFEDFVYNRTNGTPQDIFRKLGSAKVI